MYIACYETFKRFCCNLQVLVSSTMRVSIAIRLLAVLFCYMHLCSHVFAVSALCLDDQRSLLLQFKNTADSATFDYPGAGVNSGRLGTWNESVDCCQWSGVTCDHDGHVVGLDLSRELISAERKILNKSRTKIRKKN